MPGASMEIFDVAALVSAGCLAAKLFSTFIKKHLIETDLAKLSTFVKQRARYLLNTIIVLQKNSLLSENLNEKLEEAYLMSLHMDTWKDVALTDQRTTEAFVSVFETLDGRENIEDLSRLDGVIGGLEHLDRRLLDLREQIESDIERFDKKNSSIVSRAMGMPRFNIHFLIPTNPDGSPRESDCDERINTKHTD
jgi:hypothetical protein